MATLIIISSIVFALIVSFYNAYFFKLYFTRDQSDNTIVHRLGGSLRLFWMLAIFAFCWFSKVSWHDMAFYILLNLNLAWTLFDLIYNKVHNHPWYYSGTFSSNTSSVIDKLFNKFDEYIKAGILVFTILWYPFYIYEIIEDTIMNRGLELLIAAIIVFTFGYIAYRFHNKKDK